VKGRLEKRCVLPIITKFFSFKPSPTLGRQIMHIKEITQGKRSQTRTKEITNETGYQKSAGHYSACSSTSSTSFSSASASSASSSLSQFSPTGGAALTDVGASQEF